MKKKEFKIVIIIEFIVLLIFASYVFLNKDVTTQINVSLEQWESKYIGLENGIWTVDDTSIDGKENVKLLTGPNIEIPRGSYTLTIYYNCEENQSFLPFAEDPNEHYVKANEVKLDRNQTISVYDFYISENMSNFEVIFRYSGHGEFAISNISLQKNQNMMRKNFALMVFLFVLIDVLILYKNFCDEKKKYLLMISGITLLSSLPLLYKGINNGHDLMFHLARIEGIARELQLRNFPVRISSVWMSEYGYPTSIYYGDVLLYFPAFLRILGFTVTEAYKLFVFFMNLVTVIVAEWSFRKIFEDKRISILLTLAYTTVTYRMVGLYVRSAVGESSAYLFLPLIVLAIYKIYTNNEHIKLNIYNATILAVGMSGLIYTHILSAEMVVVCLLIVCIINLRKTLMLQTIRTYLISVIETLILCAGFLIPFLDYYLNVSAEITNKVSGVVPAIQRKGANIPEFFAFLSNPFGDWSTMQLTPGLLLIIVLVISVMLWYKKKSKKIMKQLTGMSVALLVMSTNVFPWDSLAHRFKLVGFLAQVQFPWRYVGIASVILTLLLGVIVANFEFDEWGTTFEKINKICVAVTLTMTCIFISYYADNAGRSIYYDTLDVDTYYIQGEEYLRTDTSVEDFTGKLEYDNIKEIDVLFRKGTAMDVVCSTGNEVGSVTFPVLNYKGYVVTDNYGSEYEIEDSDNNLVSCVVPANFNGMLSLRFEEPWYWTLTFGVSVISWIMLGSVCTIDTVKSKRKRG